MRQIPSRFGTQPFRKGLQNRNVARKGVPSDGRKGSIRIGRGLGPSDSEALSFRKALLIRNVARKGVPSDGRKGRLGPIRFGSPGAHMDLGEGHGLRNAQTVANVLHKLLDIQCHPEGHMHRFRNRGHCEQFLQHNIAVAV